MKNELTSFYSLGLENITKYYNNIDNGIFWEYPVSIEKDSYIERKNNNKLINIKKGIAELYIPFPWSTFLENNQNKSNKDFIKTKEFLIIFKKKLSNENLKTKVFTVCQHINFDNLTSIYIDLGITDIYAVYSNINSIDNNEIKIHHYKNKSINRYFEKIKLKTKDDLKIIPKYSYLDILDITYKSVLEGKKELSVKKFYEFINILKNQKFLFENDIRRKVIEIITKLNKPYLYISFLKALEENNLKFGNNNESKNIEKDLNLIYLKMEYYFLRNEYSKSIKIFSKNFNRFKIRKLSLSSINLLLIMIHLADKECDYTIKKINIRILLSKSKDIGTTLRNLFKYYKSRSKFIELDKIINFYLILLRTLRIDINKKFKFYFILFNYSIEVYRNSLLQKNLVTIYSVIKKLLSNKKLASGIRTQAHILILRYDLIFSSDEINIRENVKKELFKSLENSSNEKYTFKHINQNYNLLIKYLINQHKFIEAQDYLNRIFNNKKYLTIKKNMEDDLSLIYRGERTKRFGITAFVTAKNEYDLLPEFFNHYRKLGVEQFIYIDNDSTDNSITFLKKQSDVVLYLAKGDFDKSRSGTDWVEFLRTKWCLNSWGLFVDPDELLIIPGMKHNNNLNTLCQYMDLKNFECLNTFLLDLFKPNNFIKKNSLNYPQEFQNSSDYFYNDYVFTKSLCTPYWEVRGGVRRKIYNEDTTLNKNSIFKNKENIKLCSSTHYLSSFRPADLNGVLLHKKLLKDESVFKERSSNKSFKLPRKCTIREMRYFNRKNNKANLKNFLNDKKITKLNSYEQLEKIGLLKSSKQFREFLSSY